MTFQEALVAMESGRSVQLGDTFYGINADGVICVQDDGFYVAELTAEDVRSTAWELITTLPNLEQDESYMFFHPEKNRWVSTTNPQKHLDSGHRVAVFALDEAV